MARRETKVYLIQSCFRGSFQLVDSVVNPDVTELKIALPPQLSISVPPFRDSDASPCSPSASALLPSLSVSVLHPAGRCSVRLHRPIPYCSVRSISARRVPAPAPAPLWCVHSAREGNLVTLSEFRSECFLLHSHLLFVIWIMNVVHAY